MQQGFPWYGPQLDRNKVNNMSRGEFQNTTNHVANDRIDVVVLNSKAEVVPVESAQVSSTPTTLGQVCL